MCCVCDVVTVLRFWKLLVEDAQVFLLLRPLNDERVWADEECEAAYAWARKQRRLRAGEREVHDFLEKALAH